MQTDSLTAATHYMTKNTRFDEYQRFMGKALHQVNRAECLSLLAQAGVDVLQRLPADFEMTRQRGGASPSDVRTAMVNSRGALITYYVKIGGLALFVRLLNVTGKADGIAQFAHAIKSSPFLYILFGTSSNSKQTVRKRVYFEIATHVLNKREDGDDWIIPCNYLELSKAIVELAFAKLCSILKIGPKVGSPDHSFDLVCYDDCVEFFMEKCRSAEYPQVHQTAVLMEERLKYCVAVMHSFGLVHKDIKPDNILINTEGEFVLADFDISKFVIEKPGERSLCYQEGTRGYMSPQMVALGIRCGLVDLYYNDMWGLREAIRVFKNGHSVNVIMFDQSSSGFTEKDKQIKTLSLLLSTKGEEMNTLRKELLETSFSEFFNQINEEVVETDYDIDFLVRSVGLQSSDFSRIVACMTTMTHKADKLRRKMNLSSRRKHKFCDSLLLEEGEMRRGYTKALRRLEKKEDREEIICEAGLVWQVAAELAIYYFLYGEYEQAKQTLERVEQYVPQSLQYKYHLYMFNINSFIGSVSIEEFDKVFQGAKKDRCEVLNTAFQTFMSKRYSLSLYILQKLFPTQKVRLAHNVSPELVIMQLLQSLLKVPSPRNVELSEQVLEFASKAALYLKLHTKILSLGNFVADKSTLISKVQYFQSLANASLLCGDFRIAARKFETAYELMFKMQLTETQSSIALSLGHAFSIQMTSPSHQTKGIALRAIQFTKSLPVRAQAPLSHAYFILARFELRAGNVGISLNYLLEAISTKNNQKLPIVLLCSLLESPAYNIALFRNQILRIAKFIEEILEDQNCRLPTLQRFKVYMHLGTIYSNLKLQSNSVSCDAKAIMFLKNRKYLIDTAIALSIEIKSQHLSNPARALSFVAFLQTIMVNDICDARPSDMLRLCQNILCIKRLGKEDLAKKWVNKVLDVVTRSRIDFPCLQEQVALDLCNYSFYSEAYLLALPLLERNWLGKFVAAECLRVLDRTEESIPLFKSFVRHNRINGEDYSVDSCICRTFLSLYRIYQARGDVRQYTANLNMATKCYNSLKPLMFEQEVGLLPIKIELNQRSNDTYREYMMCKRKLFRLRHELIIPLSEAIEIAFESKQYGLGISIFQQHSRQEEGRLTSPRIRLILTKSYLILRKSRSFFRSLSEFGQDNEQWAELREFLKERRQTVKLYLLYGQVVHQHARLRSFIQSKKQSIAAKSRKCSLRCTLRDTVFGKRFAKQSKHWKIVGRTVVSKNE